MKKLVRQKVFETNSSSSHSISLGCQESKQFVLDSLYPNKDGYIILTGGEFGWEYEKTNSAESKANYAAVSTFYGLDIDMLKEVIIEQTGAKDVIIVASESYDSPNHSYIDHDSVNNCPRTKNELRDFIFNKNSWLFTGNDNQSSPPSFYDVEEYKIENNKETINDVDYKYQIVFKEQSLSEMNLKLVEYPTVEDIDKMLNFFGLRYNQTLGQFQIHSHYSGGGEIYWESNYWISQEEPKGDKGYIKLLNTKSVNKFEESLDKQKMDWGKRADSIRKFLEENPSHVMLVEFDIIDLKK